jgi:hypothetical protein
MNTRVRVVSDLEIENAADLSILKQRRDRTVNFLHYSLKSGTAF